MVTVLVFPKAEWQAAPERQRAAMINLMVDLLFHVPPISLRDTEKGLKSEPSFLLPIQALWLAAFTRQRSKRRTAAGASPGSAMRAPQELKCYPTQGLCREYACGSPARAHRQLDPARVEYPL